MEKKKLKLTITGSSKKTINNIELAKSQSKNAVVIEKRTSRYGNKKSFSIVEIWNKLINENELYGFESSNDFVHVTDIEIFNKLSKN